jgi:hypothetical protein
MKSSTFLALNGELLWSVQVFKHLLGTDPEQDELVFHETDDSFYVSLGESRSRDYIYVSSGNPKADIHSCRLPPKLIIHSAYVYGCCSLISCDGSTTAWDLVEHMPSVQSGCQYSNISSPNNILTHGHGISWLCIPLQAQPSHQRCACWRQRSRGQPGRWSSREGRMWSTRWHTEETTCSFSCATLSDPTQSCSWRPFQTPPRPRWGFSRPYL